MPKLLVKMSVLNRLAIDVCFFVSHPDGSYLIGNNFVVVDDCLFLIFKSVCCASAFVPRCVRTRKSVGSIGSCKLIPNLVYLTLR